MSSVQIFGKVLKALRTKKNLTQEEFSFQCGLERTYISMLERGINQPTLTSLMSISNALGMKLSDLIRIFEMEHDKLMDNK